MEVASPVTPTDFVFNSSNQYREFDKLLTMDDTSGRSSSPATVPFAWEEKPGVPKSSTNLFEDIDFAFDVSGELHAHASVSAEDLFQGGMIKPSKIEEIQEIQKIQPPWNDRSSAEAVHEKYKERERGRERNPNGYLTSSRSRRTRSLPPLRGSEPPPTAKSTPSMTVLAASGSGKGSRKWSFKDLFLFRSASDGRALERDPWRKYSGAIFRKQDEDLRNSSLRDRSVSGSGSKRRGRVSAHELHYTVNRAVSNDMKKKTFLPYKQGILGRLAFNPTVHALSNGFGFSHKN